MAVIVIVEAGSAHEKVMHGVLTTRRECVAISETPRYTSGDDAALLEMRVGMDVVRSTGAQRELPAVPVRPAGLSELRELRCSGRAAVSRPSGGTGRAKAPGKFLRVLRVRPPRVRGVRRGESARNQRARADEKAAGGLNGISACQSGLPPLDFA